MAADLCDMEYWNWSLINKIWFKIKVSVEILNGEINGFAFLLLIWISCVFYEEVAKSRGMLSKDCGHLRSI